MCAVRDVHQVCEVGVVSLNEICGQVFVLGLAFQDSRRVQGKSGEGLALLPSKQVCVTADWGGSTSSTCGRASAEHKTHWTSVSLPVIRCLGLRAVACTRARCVNIRFLWERARVSLPKFVQLDVPLPQPFWVFVRFASLVFSSCNLTAGMDEYWIRTACANLEAQLNSWKVPRAELLQPLPLPFLEALGVKAADLQIASLPQARVIMVHATQQRAFDLQGHDPLAVEQQLGPLRVTQEGKYTLPATLPFTSAVVHKAIEEIATEAFQDIASLVQAILDSSSAAMAASDRAAMQEYLHQVAEGLQRVSREISKCSQLAFGEHASEQQEPDWRLLGQPIRFSATRWVC